MKLTPDTKNEITIFLCMVLVGAILFGIGQSIYEKYQAEEQIRNTPVKGKVVEIEKKFRLFEESDNTIVEYSGKKFALKGKRGKVGDEIEFKQKEAE